MDNGNSTNAFYERLNLLLNYPENDIPEELRGAIAGLRQKIHKIDAKTTIKKRGRPKDPESKFKLVFFYAWFTLNIPDSGELRTRGYRRELDGRILEVLNVSENQLNRCKTIWNSFVKEDLENYLSILPVHMDASDFMGSRITTIAGLSKMEKEGALLMFSIWAKDAIKKYG